MQLKNFLIFFFTAFLCANTAISATSPWKENESKGAKTKLIASFYQDQKSGTKKLIGGIHFKIAEGWKIYGDKSDGIGMPPSLDFTGSANYSNHRIIWPTSEIGEEKIGEESLKYSFYKDEVIIPFEITLHKNDQPTDIMVRLEYGLCKDICIPANENFSLKVSEEIDLNSLKEIQKFLTEITLYSDEDLKASEPSKPEKTTSQDSSLGIISAILLALFGGLILNIMPCVLPVLSLKLLSVIHAKESYRRKKLPTKISRIRFAFASTIAGILFCFVIFAILAAIIMFSGNSFGWGLQFQNPYFLVFLVAILVIFTGNLLGLFEINFSHVLATFLHKKISEIETHNTHKRAKQKSIFIPNFLSGILAVLLATPCSAPFLGAAISFGLTQDIATIFVIFLSIGIGFASPYIILIITPKFVDLLPKPGAWMFRIEQLMAGFLIATVMWLIYILSNNIGFIPSSIIAIAAIAFFPCVRIKSLFFRYLSLALIATLMFSAPVSWKEYQKTKMNVYENSWWEFNENEIHRQVKLGNVVVVDITADWCLTCKFNKVRVLQSQEVMTALHGGNVVRMRGDITKPNEEIMQFMRKHNRFAIPFNAVFGPNAPDGLLTSELLTKKELIDLIDKAQAQE